MSVLLPSWYVPYAEAHGLDVYHPESWSDADREALRAWGVERGILAADEPAPVRGAWLSCPCHRPVEGLSDPSEPWKRIHLDRVRWWVARDPFVREGLSKQTQAALAWMDACFAPTINHRADIGGAK